MTNTTPFILPFSDINARDLGLVGGKGANLGEMTNADFPVPHGFCVTTTAFAAFIATAPDAEGLYALLDTISTDDLDSVREIGERVRQTLLEVPIPNEIADALRYAWQEIGADDAYAVRSSATAEDLPDASFAGQQDTYLNIIGEDALLDAVRRCWVSLFTDRAILYRAQNDFPHREVLLSVVVQKMIMSEKSGTLFTADPLTGHRHTVSIDASFGLGEALVSGLVTPDAYRVDKRTMTIIERQVSEKEVAIFPEKGGGTRQEMLDAHKRKQAALTDDQILKLAEMGAKIESHYGSPQDIEWAIAPPTQPSPLRGEGKGGGQLYLLQTRPVTSLYPIDGLKSPDDSLHVFFSMGHQQNMTRAMPQLSMSTFPNLASFALPLEKTSDFLRFSGNRLFIDVTLALRHPILRRVISAVLSQFDELVPQAFQLATQRPEFKRPHGLHFSFGMLKGVAGGARKVFHGLWRRDLSGFVVQTNALMDEYIAEISRHLRSYPHGKAQIEAVLASMPELFPVFLHWVPEAAAGIAATRLLPKLASRWLSPDEVEALTLGIPGNVVNEMNLMLSDLAELARQTPELAEQFKHLGEDAGLWLANIARIEGSAPFLEGWENFLAFYGSRGPSEIDISLKRWQEDPLPVLRVIAGNIEKNVSSRALFDAQAQAREAAFTKLLDAAGHGLFGKLRLRLFKRLYHVLVEAGGMREHHKFMAVRFFWVLRELLKENATELVNDGKLLAPDDIWFLTWSELLAIWDDKETSWHEIVAQRQEDFAHHLKLTPPAVITSDGETPIVQYRVDDAPPGALVGNPVSAGIIEGIVHVIHDPTTEILQPGEILVAPFTDPGWTPLFINAAGLVMDIGGALAHGSVVAREYGIPAVVGVRDSTMKLKTGQRVRVDGNRGIIEILD
ncbi:MAG: phosphoenolpyruvate synthase [Anaerolineae bacterium]|jgi:rifampicin phosphotransferase|nr:phosphoenolpyruvate synthase [Anaerolineae bacterium]MBT7323719.1 phosphoenolpyruvate synthase [Anaerolineae bacterium]